MDWGSFIIGFGGLLVAALSIYLAHKGRTSPYREMLYSKHLEGFAEVVNSLNDFYNAAQAFIAEQGERLDDETRPALRLHTLEQNQVFHLKHQKWAIFLPKELNDRLSDFIRMFNGISAPLEVEQQYPREVVHANDPGGLLGDAYIKVFAAAREGLGTEPLSQETLKLIGVSSK